MSATDWLLLTIMVLIAFSGSAIILRISTNEIINAIRSSIGGLPSKTDLERIEKIMAKQSEMDGLLEPVVTALSDVGKQLEKARVEIIKAIKDNDPEIPQTVMDKINALSTISLALKGASQALDDLNTDAPDAPPTQA